MPPVKIKPSTTMTLKEQLIECTDHFFACICGTAMPKKNGDGARAHGALQTKKLYLAQMGACRIFFSHSFPIALQRCSTTKERVPKLNHSIFGIGLSGGGGSRRRSIISKGPWPLWTGLYVPLATTSSAEKRSSRSLC